MVERSLRMREARGSIPRTSTYLYFPFVFHFSAQRGQNMVELEFGVQI